MGRFAELPTSKAKQSGVHTGTRPGRPLRLVRRLSGKRPRPTRRNKNDQVMFFFQIPKRVWAKLKGLATHFKFKEEIPLIVVQRGRFRSLCPCCPGLRHPSFKPLECFQYLAPHFSSSSNYPLVNEYTTMERLESGQ